MKNLLAIGFMVFTFALAGTPAAARLGGLEHDRALRGTWGGEHIRLDVTDSGASVEYDCAHGTIDQRIVLDRRGRFDVQGLHVQEHGAAPRQDESAVGYLVRLTGQVKGRTMKLTVRRKDNRQLIGTFTLVRGQEASLFKCL